MNIKALLSILTLGFVGFSSITNAHQLDINNKTSYKVYVSVGNKSANITGGTLESLDVFFSNNVTANVSSNAPGVNPGSCTIDPNKIKSNSKTKLTISTSKRSFLLGKTSLKCNHSA
ncbi:MAG: hypothetical protein Q8L85_02390 [Alphaproteobacteria bacterium]|nr:hypothetical protein [Alphaproteobacteria bacterium]